MYKEKPLPSVDQEDKSHTEVHDCFVAVCTETPNVDPSHHVPLPHPGTSTES